MIMTEIVGSEKEIDLIVEINHKTITEMTIEKKITGRTKIGNIEVDIEIIMETCDDRYIDNCRTIYKGSYRDKYREKDRDDSFDSDRGRSREKHCLHNARKDNGLVSNNPKIK